jgi:hypothetical protein
MPHIPGHSPFDIPIGSGEQSAVTGKPIPSYISAPSIPGFTTAVDAGNLIKQLQDLFQRNINMPGNTPPMTREAQNNLLRDLFQRTMGALQAQGQAMSQLGQAVSGVDTPPYTLPMLNNMEQRSQAPVMNPQQFANFAQRSTPPKPGGQQLTTRQMAQQQPPNPGASPFDPNSPTFNRNAFQPQQLPPGY